jgi:hypothetical protein
VGSVRPQWVSAVCQLSIGLGGTLVVHLDYMRSTAAVHLSCGRSSVHRKYMFVVQAMDIRCVLPSTQCVVLLFTTACFCVAYVAKFPP